MCCFPPFFLSLCFSSPTYSVVLCGFFFYCCINQTNNMCIYYLFYLVKKLAERFNESRKCVNCMCTVYLAYTTLCTFLCTTLYFIRCAFLCVCAHTFNSMYFYNYTMYFFNELFYVLLYRPIYRDKRPTTFSFYPCYQRWKRLYRVDHRNRAI